jgi:hypothetical protein
MVQGRQVITPFTGAFGERTLPFHIPFIIQNSSTKEKIP